MKNFQAAACAVLIALSAGARADESLPPDPGQDAARQQRMDEAYRDHQAHPEGTFERAEDATKRGAHKAGAAIAHGASATGHAVKHAAVATGHAISHGAHATGHAISQAASATGHAIHRGYDKLTGKSTQ
jgi:hypothetical protein